MKIGNMISHDVPSANQQNVAERTDLHSPLCKGGYLALHSPFYKGGYLALPPLLQGGIQGGSYHILCQLISDLTPVV